MAPTYQYNRLKTGNTIRILSLEPGNHDDPIICRLISVAIDHAPPYEAISFDGGSALHTQAITCDGDRLEITANLGEVLRRVRLPQARRLLWADAVCIDQDNPAERRLQAQLTSRIFHRARKVLIWLGPDDDGEVRQCLDFITQIVRACRSSPSTSLDRTAQPAHPRPAKDLKDLVKGARLVKNHPPDSPSWAMLARLFDRPWFRRVGAIPELSASRAAQVLIGDAELSWHYIAVVATWLASQPEGKALFGHAHTRGVENVQFMCNNTKDHQIETVVPHLTLFQNARNFEAADARDKIYAMLNQPINVRQDHYHEFRFRRPWRLLLCFYVARAASTAVLYDFVGRLLPMTGNSWLSLAVLAHSVAVVALWEVSRYLPARLFFPDKGFKAPSRISSAMLTWISMTPSTALQLGAPDYSAPVEELNKQVATQTVKEFNRLDFLSYVDHGPTIDEEFPSWVPQWHQPTGDSHVLATYARDSYRADAGATGRWLFPQGPYTKDHWLIAQGLQIGVVSSTSEVLISPTASANNFEIPLLPTSSSSRLDKLNDVLERHGDPAAIYAPTGEDMRTACLMTLTASQSIDRPRTERQSPSGENPCALPPASILPSAVPDSEKGPSAPSALGATAPPNKAPPMTALSAHAHLAAAAARVCHRRRYLVTAGGQYHGVGPEAMRAGDVVFVLFGGGVPYVLRPVHAEQPLLFVLVGECYVHGLMDGQAVAMWEKAGGASGGGGALELKTVFLD